MNLIDIEAAVSPSPIVAAFARGTARHTAGDSDRDPSISNNSDAEGAGINVEGIDRSDIKGRAGELGIGTNPCKRSLQRVSTIEKRVEVIKWMVKDANENGEKGVVLRTIISSRPSSVANKTYVYNYLVYILNNLTAYMIYVYCDYMFIGQSYELLSVVEVSRRGQRP